VRVVRLSGRALLRAAVTVLAIGQALDVPADASRAQGSAAVRPPILTDVLVVREGDRWTADFTFQRDAPVWMFIDSAVTRAGGEPWRPRSWVIETPGVRVERRRWHDVFSAENGGPVPRRVRVRFTPFAQELRSAYEPARVFSDGSVALYTDQFDVSPLASLAAADAMPMDLNGIDLEGGAARVTFEDRAGPVLLRGERQNRPIAIEARSYALFGAIPIGETEHLVTVVDPGLPAWMRAELSAFTPRLLTLYAERLGAALPVRPTVLASWAGPTPSRTSMGGGVLPGLVMLSFEGDGVASFSDRVRLQARSFLAHEAAHFWLGQLVRYERVRDSWITEGGADLLAIRATSALDAAYGATDRIQAAVDECVRLSAGKAVHTASERGEPRAYYSCGAVFAFVAEAASARTGGDLFTFIRALLDANRRDGVLTGREWLDDLSRVSGDGSLSADMLRMLEAGVADPAALIGSLFSRVGVAHDRRDGRVLLAQ
jgi:hypothetical protein